MNATITLALIEVLLDLGINFTVQCGQVIIKDIDFQNIYTGIKYENNKWQILFYRLDGKKDTITFQDYEYDENTVYDRINEYIENKM